MLLDEQLRGGVYSMKFSVSWLGDRLPNLGTEREKGVIRLSN
ncbi:hypothetical protein J5U23_01560 [Saccharolobus shibatae B12]|uniref:Uncharacterized protein n=1 Tax=Saccharolobus shibatae (strain ATCC 51178 / DSM 5389 / JCM 8931 / NBRC 15437 / B12) TaxID=523848 RepID=A0A8F5BP12_SACSH|nr:hypothetical protein J5U23_01560 [Saccharolobus shibatae B12]